MRGHGLVCEAAVHLVNNKELKRFLTAKIPAMTYLCNLPDTYWKSIPEGAPGYFTHFFEPDIMGMNFETMPTSFQEVEALGKGKMNLNTNQPILSVAREVGSNWWRADQFLRLSLAAAKRAKASGVLIKDDPDVYQMWVMMGLMGHFIGDNAQPFHNTRDYDGWVIHHGGIHRYYEGDLVDALPPDILSSIIKRAPRATRELQLKNQKIFIEHMRTLSILSYKDIQLLIKQDPILEKSTVSREKGMEIRKEAKRKEASLAIRKFEKHLVTHLSRGAVLLAWSWDQIFNEAEKPPIDRNNSYQFPHQFKYIPTDYSSPELSH